MGNTTVKYKKLYFLCAAALLPICASAESADCYPLGTTVASGESLWSANSEFQLTVQSSDGHVVEYNHLQNDTPAMWAISTTMNHPGDNLQFQQDGNLVAYDSNGKALWASKTQNKGAYDLCVQSADGDIVIYDKNGHGIWKSGATFDGYNTKLKINNNSSNYNLQSCTTTCSNGFLESSQSLFSPNTNGILSCKSGNNTDTPINVSCEVHDNQNNIDLGKVYFTASYNWGSNSFDYHPHSWGVIDAQGNNQWNYNVDPSVEPMVSMQADQTDKNQMDIKFKMVPRFTNQKVQGDYGDVNGQMGSVQYSNVSNYNIVPYGTSCVSSMPGWLCNADSDKSNGIYRISFSYDISDNNLLQQPPAVAFQVLASDKKTLLGRISRSYNFYYRQDANNVSLKEEFNYVAPYNPSQSTAGSIYLQAGYYKIVNNSKTFVAVGSPYEINLDKADQDNISLSGSYPNIQYKYDDDNEMTSNMAFINQAVLFNNGMHQGKLEPLLCAGTDASSCLSYGSIYVKPGITNSQDAHYNDSLLYKHILMVEDTSGGDTGDTILSNFQPENQDGASVISTKFSQSFLKSADYCELIPAEGTAPQVDGQYSINTANCVGYQGDTGEKMVQYPPAVGQPNQTTSGMANSTPSPMYFSVRPTMSADSSTNIGLCYVYDDKQAGLTLKCAKELDGYAQAVTQQGELPVKAIQGSVSDTNNANALGLRFYYDQNTKQINVYDNAMPQGGSALTQNFLPDQLFLGNPSWMSNSDTDSSQNVFMTSPDMRYLMKYNQGKGYDPSTVVGSVPFPLSSDAPVTVSMHSGTTYSLAPYFQVSVDESSNDLSYDRYIMYTAPSKAYTITGTAENYDHISVSINNVSYNDWIGVYGGFPLWGVWLGNDYAHAGSAQTFLGNQPFMVVDDTSDGANQNNNSDYHQYMNDYHQLGYDNYAEGTMVVPMAISFANKSGSTHDAVNQLSPNTDQNQTNYGTDLYRGCSWVSPNDTNNMAMFANSYCVYAALGADNANNTHINIPAVNANYMSSVFALNGVRDIFGNKYPTMSCNTSKSCTYNEYTGDTECLCN